MRQLALDEGKDFPLASQIVFEEISVDDVLIRKWIANDVGLIDGLNKDLLACEEALEMNTDFNVLGLNWCSKGDFFSLN